MRVNHVGEICAQALYTGQGLLARDSRARDIMRQAAREEHDHLVWCKTRLEELGQRTSLLVPVWYGGSLLIGALAALGGDRKSLAFLAETENQVATHLAGHLQRLPPEDERSRQILERMLADERGHERTARENGAGRLPRIARPLMRAAAGVMKTIAARI